MAIIARLNFMVKRPIKMKNVEFLPCSLSVLVVKVNLAMVRMNSSIIIRKCPSKWSKFKITSTKKGRIAKTSTKLSPFKRNSLRNSLLNDD